MTLLLFQAIFKRLIKIKLMSVLEVLGISGFRSYSPKKLQKIEFKTPLTLIWGKNGSGKTTIIEILKYITTGSLPPSGEKGKNFLMQPRMVNQSEVVGECKLKFLAYNQRQVLATRRALLTVSQKGTKFQSIEQLLKTKDDDGKIMQINHLCAQIEKQIPLLMGSSKAILDKIVFCHQDESLWPFQDSATLKSIFDQLFQTRKFTQIIDALWQQKKECQKKVNQSKKAYQYLERLYEQDKRRKIKSLKEMININKELEGMSKMREIIKKLRAEVDDENQGQLNNLRFELGRERRSLEEKLEYNRKERQSAQMKIQTLKKKYFQLEHINFKMNYEQSKMSLQQVGSYLEELKKKYNQLKDQLLQLQNTQSLNQKEIQLNSEINIAKELLPGLNSYNLSEEQICSKVNERLKILDRKKEELVGMRRQLQDGEGIQRVTDMAMNEDQFIILKKQLSDLTKTIAEYKQSICIHFINLYKQVDQKKLIGFKQNTSLPDQLKQLRYKITLKKEQLKKYQELPRNCQNLQQTIFKLRFAGIQLYEGFMDFCNEKKKCSLCSKPISAEDLAAVRIKAQKMKDRTLKQIGELEAQIPHSANGIDPQVAIPRVMQEIAEAVKIQNKMQKDCEEQELKIAIREQLKINQKLKEGVRKAKLEEYLLSIKGKVKQKVVLIFEDFQESTRNYIIKTSQYQNKKNTLINFEKQKQRNKEILKRNEELRSKNKKYAERVISLEQQVKNYELVSRTASKLQQLLRQKGQQPVSNARSKVKTNLKTLQQNVQQLQLKVLTQQTLYELHQLVIHHQMLGQENKNVDKKIELVDEKLDRMINKIQILKNKTLQLNQSRLQFQKKQRQLDLRGQIAFQQYTSPFQQQFLIEKNTMLRHQKSIKDFELASGAVEKTISTIHLEKMDEVNNIIGQLWRQVYHENDIKGIRINTRIQEDGKKRKNYHYSIAMQKVGQNSVDTQMKGRCSMGQKVLASIVIRLALAQVFSNSSRILALDQPTTFLDRQHIIALANSLCKLIQINQHLSLQLIIISHDLEFIKLLERFTPDYCEVSRDKDQFSVITTKSIKDLFDTNRASN